MAPNKKKKKPAANPARGFATTSQPSKSQVANPGSEAQAESTSTATSEVGTPATSAERNEPSAGGQSEPSSLQSMSPEELEQHLEDAELQSLLDRCGQRCRLDSDRHVIRLQNERRQSRPLSHPIFTDDWLTDDALNWSLEQYKFAPDSGPTTPANQINDEKLTLDLWVLHRVLTTLGFPEVRRALTYVISLSVKQQLKSTVTTAYGFNEALDWYAFHFGQKELPIHDEQSAQRITPAASDRPAFEKDVHIRPSVMETTVEAQDNSNSERHSVSEEEFGEALEEIDIDDDDDVDVDEDDPSRLTDRWIALQTRLWKRANQVGMRNLKARTSKLRELENRVQEIERDILFDKDEADLQWMSIKIQLERRLALQRAEANAPAGNRSSGTTTPGSADYVHRSAAEAALGDDPLDQKDDMDVFGAIFDAAETENSTNDASNGVEIRDFGRYTGMSPQSLLKQTCQAIDSKATIKIAPTHQTSYSARHRLDCYWQTLQEPEQCAVDALPRSVTTTIDSTHWKFEMKTIATSTAASSADYVSVIALGLVLSLRGQDFKTAKRLPGVWSNLLADFSSEQKRLTEDGEKLVLREIRDLVSEARANLAETFQGCSPARYNDSLTLRAPRHHERIPPGQLSPDMAQYAWNSRVSRKTFQHMLRFRSQLPIHRHKEEILQTITENPVVIICAETGSGKSTQVGSYILEQQLSYGRECHILVTQPRRISAISLARRVSQEIGERDNDLGTTRSLVGYAIRLESKTSEMTRLTFATTGVLLRMLESSPTLEHLDYLILDEIHERTMEMDLAFIALQRLQQIRPNLKIILMSATVNAAQFSRYFGEAPILAIEGRTFPVTIKYLEDAIEVTNDIAATGIHASAEAEEDIDSDERDVDKNTARDTLRGYSQMTIGRLRDMDEYKIDYDLIVKLATAIATKPTFLKFSKAILIFMPGIAEIRRLFKSLTSSPTFSHQWDIHMLHSSFSTEELERAFTVPSYGNRKIVIATNIAETGITIPDVTAVIDTCKEKIMRFDERRQFSRLTEGFVARSSAKQRRGRAARVQQGLCFHLVTKYRHDNLFLEQQVPEMLRLSLQDSIMRIKLWDAEASIEQTLASAIDPPSKKNVRRAIERLKEAGALDTTEYLTALGERVARLPLDVSLAKLAILGAIFGCLDPILTIISLVTSKGIFSSVGPGKAVFQRGGSDLLTVLAAYEGWRKASVAGKGAEFARKHHLINLAEIEDNKVQLVVYLVDGGLIKLDSDEKRTLNTARVSSVRRGFYALPERYNVAVNDDLMLSLIATSFYPRCLIREGKGYRNIFSNQQVNTARGSVVREMAKPPKWLSYSEAIRMKAGNAINIHEASRIPDMALSLFLGFDVDVNLFSGVVSVDGRIRLKAPEWKQLLAIKLLRKQLRSLLERRYRAPDQSNAKDDQLIDLLRRAGHP